MYSRELGVEVTNGVQGHAQGGGLPGCSPAPPPSKHPKPKFKRQDFSDILLSEVLCELPFGRNQPLKSAGDQYVRISKNKLIKLKNKKTEHCDRVMGHVVIFAGE
jgi:hypothetical protein